MNLREKYGEWGIILGATEGVGKAFAEKIASEGMSVVLVGRREEKRNFRSLERVSAKHMVWITWLFVQILHSPTVLTRFLKQQKTLIWDS